MQLTLSLFGDNRIRPAFEMYLATQCHVLAEATAIDYQERARWIYGALGEWTPLDDVTYPALVKLIRVHGPDGKGLRYVTLKKRLRLLRAVIDHAHNMGICKPPPKLPRLPDDGKPGKALHSRGEFAAFRMALAPGKFRTLADLAFWTGHHTYDLFETRREHFDLNYDWPDGHKGAFWRRNHKTRNCHSCWFPSNLMRFRLLRRC